MLEVFNMSKGDYFHSYEDYYRSNNINTPVFNKAKLQKNFGDHETTILMFDVVLVMGDIYGLAMQAEKER